MSIDFTRVHALCFDVDARGQICSSAAMPTYRKPSAIVNGYMEAPIFNAGTMVGYD